MANRVLLGNNGSEYGLFVSQKDDNVVSPSKQLSFDSRSFGGLPVHAFGEGTIDAPNTTASDLGVKATRSTSALGYSNLGFTPLFALRWCYPSDITSGKAVRVYTPSIFLSQEEVADFDGSTEEETIYTETKQAGAGAVAGASSIVITNYHSGKSVVVEQDDAGLAPTEETGTGKIAIKYAYVVFGVEDFTGGTGL